MSAQKTLIFDFDGTIADSFALVVDIFHELTGRSPALSAEEIRALRGHSGREVVKKLGIRWYRLPFLVAKGRKTMHRRLGEVQPFPGIGPILYQLRNRGYQLFVVSTNERVSIERFLTEHDMRQFFEEIYGNIGLFGKAKALRKILREQELRTQDCIYIGDEERDVSAAKKLTMPTIAVTWGYNSEQALRASGPTYVARKPEELLTICQG